MVLLDKIFGYANVEEEKCHPVSDEQSVEFTLCAILGPLAETDISAGFLGKLSAMDASPTYGAVCSMDTPLDVTRA